jgi:hypothetical protein
VATAASISLPSVRPCKKRKIAMMMIYEKEKKKKKIAKTTIPTRTHRITMYKFPLDFMRGKKTFIFRILLNNCLEEVIRKCMMF